eukprot:2870004-Pyramimonas_sp.AAC.1
MQEVVSDGIAPFMLTYLCNSMFVLYLPVVEFGNTWEWLTGRKLASSKAVADFEADSDEDVSGLLDDTQISSPEEQSAKPYTRMETARAAL